MSLEQALRQCVHVGASGSSKTVSASSRTGHFSYRETSSPEKHHSRLTDHTPLFVFALPASYRLLLDVHEVAVYARSPCARRNHAVSFPDVLHLFVFQGLSLQHVAVLHGNLPMEVGAHLIRQFSQGEQSPKHRIDVLVALGGDLEVCALLVSGHELLDLLMLHLSVELSVAFVPADHKRHIDVLFDLVF